MDIEDPKQLEDYLRSTRRIGRDDRVECRTLGGGVSNRTVLVKRCDGPAWVLKQALAKLRVKVDWFSDPARVHREALGLNWLGALAPAGSITPLVFEDEAHHLLAMEAVPEPHENFKSALLSGRIDFAHIREFAALLATIHRESFLRRDELLPVFDDRSFFESLRLEPYYLYAGEQVPEARAFLHELVEQTRAARQTIVHGDYSPKNVLIHDGRLVLLDHEVIHFGEPAFDVGFAMTHLLSKAHHLSVHRAAFTQAATIFWDRYFAGVREVLGEGIEARAARQTLGCLLARVAGRSPLEYLDEEERTRQRRAVLSLIDPPPARMPELIAKFVGAVS